MFSITDIKERIGGQGSLINPEAEVVEVAFDSRKIADGRNTLFLCLTGPVRDGHDYAHHAYANGVRNFLAEQELNLVGANVIIVDNVLKTFQEWMKVHRESCSSTQVIGITGSNGKTVIKEWLYQLVSTEKRTSKSPRSYNSSIGVPISLSQINPEDEISIIEAGISAVGEMSILEKMIRPDIGIFTNIGTAHEEGFESREEKLREKASLFRRSSVIIYRKDYGDIDAHLTKVYPDKSLISWGYASEANYQVTNIDSDKIALSWSENNIEITIPRNDYVTIENLIFAIITAIELGINQHVIKEEIKNFLQPSMRMEQVDGIDGSILINDAYSSDLQSLQHSLQFAESLDSERPLSLIISDFHDVRDQKAMTKAISDILKKSKISRLISIGKSSVNLHSKGDHYHFPDTPSFYAVVDDFDWENHVILVKGARKFNLDILAEKLENKSHSAVLEIDLTALHHNISAYEKIMEEGCRFIAVIKASAYGGGIEKLAKEIDAHDPAYLAVANADEGLSLRQIGIERKIIVLNPDPAKVDVLFAYRLEPEVYSVSMLQAIESESTRRQESISIHLKMDSGMGRLGMREEDIDAIQKILQECPYLKVGTIFSHLSSADDLQEDNYSFLQIDAYNAFYNSLTSAWALKPKRHILNSTGAKRFPNHQYDYIRIGIGLYGIGVPQMPSLIPVHSLKASIISIKQYDAGASIGYNRSAILSSNTLIGVINIGYADGLLRKGSCGRTSFFYQGNAVKVVGNICMDMTMIDLTHVGNPQVGDQVEIFGVNNHIEELARGMDTIPYEVLSRIAPRVKRKFIIL